MDFRLNLQLTLTVKQPKNYRITCRIRVIFNLRLYSYNNYYMTSSDNDSNKTYLL